MEPFTTLTSHVAAIEQSDIDTDVIFPARFLLLMDREGLGEHLFADRRFDADGKEQADFPLNDPACRDAQILLAGANFGSGSSREHAVWAVADYGFRCVMAPSFGPIFFNNCIKNGLLPISFDHALLPELFALARAGERFEVDLVEGFVQAGPLRLPITLGAAPREMLLNGWDESDVILSRHAAQIDAFENNHCGRQPWLRLKGNR